VLRSEIQSQESVFNAMLTRMEQVEINQSDNESEVEISNLAQLPGLPVSPVGSKILMMGLFAGIAFGGAIAFGSIRLDNKFHTVMQLEELLEQPVLAAISRITPAKAFDDGGPLAAGKGTRILESQQAWDPRIVFRQGQRTSTYAEMFRVLRASITLLGPEDKRKVTLFTSAIPGEGKTLVSVNFALAAAGQGKRVLLIDLDLRRPNVQKVLGVSPGNTDSGVTGYLSGKTSFDESLTRNIGGDGLDLMLAGARTPNPGELLNGNLLTSLIAEAREKYDVIVLDTAPLLAVPDTRVLARYADNVCLVVRAEYVPKGATERVMRLLAADRTPLAGLILNSFVERRSRIAFNYSYGYYKYSQSGNTYGAGDEGYGAKGR
jgi:capsular exopolysaccharide synthesis family protein